MSTFEYKRNNGAFAFGIFLWILAILILVSLGAYFSGSTTGSSGFIGSYTNAFVAITFEILLFLFVLIGAYLIFTMMQEGTDFKKYATQLQRVQQKILKDPCYQECLKRKQENKCEITQPVISAKISVVEETRRAKPKKTRVAVTETFLSDDEDDEE